MSMAMLVCAACAVRETPVPPATPIRFQVAGIEIRNELPSPVTDVQVLIQATGGFVSCGTIHAGSACATSFPQRAYRGDPISVTWKEHGAPQSAEPFELQAPAGAEPDRLLWVQVVIFAPGEAGARLLGERPPNR